LDVYEKEFFKKFMEMVDELSESIDRKNLDFKDGEIFDSIMSNINEKKSLPGATLKQFSSKEIKLHFE